MPYNENLKIFYLNYLPYITIILFVFTTIFLLNPKNKLEYFIVTLAILNPSTLLLIERFNNDIFVFLILIIIALNRFYIFNWLLIFLLFFNKTLSNSCRIFYIYRKQKKKLYFFTNVSNISWSCFFILLV